MKDQARNFAIARHGNQKYGDEPYSFHLDAVADIASAYGVQAEVVAYLHDVVEDTATTVEDIADRFGSFVAHCVDILTDEPGPDRKARKAATYARMSKVSGEAELALLVKAADRLANFRACLAQANDAKLRMYKAEHKLFREAVYRPDLCDVLWREMDEIARG
ncbi:MAG: HD domain-containing protein [Halioglobus sp.]|nr:HD domain-containing protein [Halioglobus sp.]